LARSETFAISSSEDVVRARQLVRAMAVEAGLKLTDQTKIVTAASELARNMVIYGGGGVLSLEIIGEGDGTGVRLTFEDTGPGIPDVQLAMKDGYTTGVGLGLGLSGSRRLCNEFEISSKLGEGTRVTVTRWK
jgi:serine/threonine-protein kinase RsbT